MKNKIVVGCLIVLIIFFSILAFYFWYNYFLKLGSDGNLSGLNQENEIIKLIDENKVYATYKEGIEEPINVEGYKFRIENRSNNNVRYNLTFVEVSPNQVNDGCSKKTLLKADELNYQLIHNEQIISQGKVSQISDKVFEERNINGKSSNSYELKVWLNSSSDNNEGKHFHYKVELKAIK